MRSPDARRAAAGAVAVVVIAAVLVFLGLWERERHAEAAVDGMRATLAAIGPLDASTLAGYRVLERADCLVYRRGTNPFALEACVDAAGRVVETIDRRRPDRRIDTLRQQPSLSTLRVDRRLVDRLLRRMGAPCCR